MGPVGLQEMAFIFLLALLLFGPKKLPELGRMLGRAMSEFRRAQTELKSTFEREMRNLERETESLKEITSSYNFDHQNYDYSSSDSPTYDPYVSEEPADSTVTDMTTVGASATQGVDSAPAVHPPEGAIAHGTEIAAANHYPHEGSPTAPAGEPAAVTTSTAEHNA